MFPLKQHFYRDDKAVTQEDKAKAMVKQEGLPPPSDGQRDRLLKGVMRVGLLAKGLLLKTDKEVAI